MRSRSWTTPRRWDVFLFWALVLPAAAAACSGSGDEVASNDNNSSGGNSGKPSGKAGSGGNTAGSSAAGGSTAQGGTVSVSDPEVTALAITPPQGSITLTNGVPAPAALSFEAQGTTSSGAKKLDQVVWTLDPSTFAGVDASGQVTATGKGAGVAKLTAAYKNLTATAEVTVHLAVVEAPTDGSFPEDAKTKLAQASAPDPSVRLAYPYDQTVFPLGVLPPTLMWGGASPEDLYRIQLTAPYGTIEVYTAAPEQRYTLPEQPWLDLLRDAKGAKVQLKVARLSQGNATVVAEQTWNVGTGPLRGTVYYWGMNIGRVLRIKPGAKQPDDFLAAAGVNDGCTSCHTVSADGSTLTIGGGKNGDPNDSAASVFDLKNNQLTRTYDQGYGRPWAMPALSPDGKYAVLNDANLPGDPGLGGGLFEVATAQKVPGTALDSFPVGMPYFSADGSSLVYVDINSKNLGAFDYNQAGVPGGAFANQRELIPASGLAGNAEPIGYPASTPDGKWAIYQRGPSDALLDSRNGSGDLFLASLDQPNVEIPLDALNGALYPFTAGDRDRHWNYEPTFAPLPAGGYFWVIFTSRRTYGNLRTGTKDEVKLLWMAAIDQHPEPGKDPSHPPFLLQGQDTSTLNMRAFWVFEPCKANGSGCEFGSDCCEGFCEPDSSGALACSSGNTGQPGPCVPTGNKCKESSDCCQKGSECINNFCADPPPDID